MLGRKGFLLALALSSITLVAETAAHAANANFQCDCTGGSGSATSCECSPNKAPAGQPYTGCNGAGVSYYYWTFGDGNYYLTYPTIDGGKAYHTYPAGPLSVTVQLQVTCNNGVIVSNSHCLNSTPTTGCIIVNGGWSPY
jgi:hypothetical protein